MNKVILIGNLTKDPEQSKTSSGIESSKFTIAVQRSYAGQDGERGADFINIIAWRGQAENCNKYLKKGRKVAVEGEIRTRIYDAQDGTKRYITEVLAEKVEFLSKADDSDKGEKVDLQPVDDDNLPF